MESLLPVINKLQDVMVNLGENGAKLLDLPQIAVVGAQSAGKSSVLESLVGRDFLPRGQGIVTRRPLILQLRNVPPRAERAAAKAGAPRSATGFASAAAAAVSSSDSEISSTADENEFAPMRRTGSGKENSAAAGCASDPSVALEFPAEYGVFHHLPDKKFTDFSEIRAEIERETEKVAGTDKGISQEPILLIINSPNVIDLSLVDLPGLTKNPVGDQPPDIEDRIREMINAFILKPNCLILAVSPANIDIATSDALKLAREADPEGDRTIGVLTKCDLVEDHAVLAEIINNDVLPLRLGYAGVVCRSHKQVKANASIEEALKQEREFFDAHPAYELVADKCGTKNLGILLNQVLLTHIQKVVPALKKRVKEQIGVQTARLKALGTSCPTKELRRRQLLESIERFASRFRDIIDGRNVPRSAVAREAVARGPGPGTPCPRGGPRGYVLEGGARIDNIIHDWYGRKIDKYQPLKSLSDHAVQNAIRHSRGSRARLFPPDEAFEQLVVAQIEKLEEPAVWCVDKIFGELSRIVGQCDVPAFAQYPQLKRHVLRIAKEVLRGCQEPTLDIVKNIIKMERTYINIRHVDFPKASLDALQSMMAREGQAEVGGGGEALRRGGAVGAPRWDVVARRASSDSDEGLDLDLGEVPSQIVISADPTDREARDIRTIKQLIEAYFNIVRKNVMDLVPKAIMTFMVEEAKQNMHQELTSQLFNEVMVERLMSEDPLMQAKRLKCTETLGILNTALQIMDTIKNYNFDQED